MIVQAVLHWGDTWGNHHVKFYCDNQAVAVWINSGTSRSPDSMALIHLLSMLAACLNFSYSSIWIPSEENVLADAASRFQYSRLFQLAPHLPCKPCYLKSHLTGLKRTLTSHDRLQPSSGMVSHPALTNPIPQVSVPSSTSPDFILDCLTNLENSCQQPLRSLLSGLQVLGPMHSSPKPLNPTCQPFVPSMSMKVFHLMLANPRQSVESSMESNVFMEKGTGIPSFPSLRILQQLAAVSGDCSIRNNAIFDATMKVAWAGFLCCGEFTLGTGEKFNPAIHLMQGCITFEPSLDNPTHAHFNLPASKTDPFQKGVSILIAKAPPGSTTCAVSALQKLFQLFPESPNAPLFDNEEGSALTRSSFISTLKSHLAIIGLDPSLYSGHSFHHGAASAAAAVGYADHEIQLLGRWRSDAYKLYIDVPKDRILGLSACLHSAILSAEPFEPLALPFTPALA